MVLYELECIKSSLNGSTSATPAPSSTSTGVTLSPILKSLKGEIPSIFRPYLKLDFKAAKLFVNFLGCKEIKQ